MIWDESGSGGAGDQDSSTKGAGVKWEGREIYKDRKERGKGLRVPFKCVF